ncbi:hypothetical protein JST97_24485 [bacterium]|nr:hypothetical protein [bacterium]
MQIQRNNHQNPAQRRSAEIVRDSDYRIDAVVSAGKRDGFDSKGRFSQGSSHCSSHLLANFSSAYQRKVKIDPETRDVQSFFEQMQGGRRSFFVGDQSSLERHTMKSTGDGKIYERTVREFSEEKCESYTEKVKVHTDGQTEYRRRDHFDGKVERFLRANPSIRILGGQATGGAIGAGLGTAVAMYAGASPYLGVAAGACVGATFGGGLASKKPADSRGGLLELAAYLPAQLIQLAAGLGTAGVFLGCLIIGCGH